MNVYQVAETGTLNEVIASLTEDEGTDELVSALDMNDRDDLLKELSMRALEPERRKAAIEQMEHRKRMADSHKAWDAKVSAYPPIFKKWHEILVKSPKVGLFDVSFPSQTALRHDLDEKYVAVCGDGLWLFHFEILSLKGDGLFRLAEHPTGKDDLGHDCTEGRDSLAFRTTGGCEFNDNLTGTRILQILTGIYGDGSTGTSTDKKKKPPVWPVALACIFSFWLGHQACKHTVEMTGESGSPFSPYIQASATSGHQP